MPVKTFQVRSDNPSNDSVSTSINAYLTFIWLICNVLFFHVRQQENCFEWKLCTCTHSCSMDRKEREPDWFDWLVESDAPPRSFPGVSKEVSLLHWETAKLETQRITVKFSEVSEPLLLARLSIKDSRRWPDFQSMLKLFFLKMTNSLTISHVDRGTPMFSNNW